MKAWLWFKRRPPFWTFWWCGRGEMIFESPAAKPLSTDLKKIKDVVESWVLIWTTMTPEELESAYIYKVTSHLSKSDNVWVCNFYRKSTGRHSYVWMIWCETARYWKSLFYCFLRKGNKVVTVLLLLFYFTHNVTDQEVHQILAEKWAFCVFQHPFCNFSFYLERRVRSGG